MFFTQNIKQISIQLSKQGSFLIKGYAVAHRMLLIEGTMRIRAILHEKMSILDVATFVGLAAIFFAVAVPLIRGAALKNRAAECARKMMWAVDAFDSYASASGEYPPNSVGAVPCYKMSKIFYDLEIDWWGEKTEMGGAWKWFSDDQRGFIAIFNPQASERHMKKLDMLIDDGNLDAGVFRRYGPIYCYIIKKQRQV